MSALTAIAAAINEQHRQAIAHAGQAIDHAKQAGELLLKVKADLQHGDFLPWVAANVAVTPRQAQRYMAAAQGKPMPVRAIKYDTVSHLRKATRPPVIEIPLGSVGWCDWTNGDGQPCIFEVHSVLWPDGETVGLHYAWMLCGGGADGGASAGCTRRPIRASAVSVEKLAAPYLVPIDRMQVIRATPDLWSIVSRLPA